MVGKLSLEQRAEQQFEFAKSVARMHGLNYFPDQCYRYIDLELQSLKFHTIVARAAQRGLPTQIIQSSTCDEFANAFGIDISDLAKKYDEVYAVAEENAERALEECKERGRRRYGGSNYRRDDGRKVIA